MAPTNSISGEPLVEVGVVRFHHLRIDWGCGRCILRVKSRTISSLWRCVERWGRGWGGLR